MTGGRQAWALPCRPHPSRWDLWTKCRPSVGLSWAPTAKPLRFLLTPSWRVGCPGWGALCPDLPEGAESHLPPASPQSSSLSLPEGGSGHACWGLAQHHPEKKYIFCISFWVRTCAPHPGGGAWLEARLAQAPGLWIVPCEPRESPGRLCQPLVPMEQTRRRCKRFAPGLSRKSNPSISSRSYLVLEKPHEGQGLEQTLVRHPRPILVPGGK